MGVVFMNFWQKLLCEAAMTVLGLAYCYFVPHVYIRNL